MKETIERLRRARAQLLRVAGTYDLTLHTVAEDIELSIADLEKVQVAAESFVPTFEAFVKAVEKAVGLQVRKTCICGVVNVTQGLRGYVEYAPGLTNPQCPIHGKPGVVITNV